MAVQLELQVLPGGQAGGQPVAVSLHVLGGDCATPTRSFRSPLSALLQRDDRQAESPSPAAADEQPDAPEEQLCDAAGIAEAAGVSGHCSSRCAAAAAVAPASPAAAPSTFEQQLEQAAASDAAAAGEAMTASDVPAAAAPAAAAALAAPRPAPEPCSRGGSPRGASAASLDAVMRLLQQVLESSSAAVQQAQEVAAAPLAVPPLPASVDKLLALELEVVQLQQSLQIAQLEFETRTVQLHSLKQRADEAEHRGQAAEEQAARLRQQLDAAHLALEREQAAQRRAAAAHQQQLAAAQEQLLAAQREGQELRAHVAAACGALQALGVASTHVFSRAALQLAGVPADACVAPLQPQRQQPAPPQQAQLPQPQQQQVQQPALHQAAAAPAPAPPPPPPPPSSLPAQLLQQQQQQAQQQPQSAGRPQVPRLQLSSISLEQLQQAATHQHEGGAAVAAGTPTSQGLPPLPSSSQRYSHLRVAVAASPRDAAQAASPARSMQNSAEHAPLLTARRAMSPAQQELLASARQWRQLTARSAVADEEENAAARMPAHRPQQQQQQQQSGVAGGHATARAAAPPGAAARPPLRAVQTARQHHATPRKQAAAAALRWTYGQDPAFLEIKKAYMAVVASEADSTARWARSVFSSSSAVETEPRRVEPVVQGLLQLFRESGVAIPLQKVGPCQYRLGAAKLAVRLVNGRLMARAGAGQTVDVLDWLGRQPVPT